VATFGQIGDNTLERQLSSLFRAEAEQAHLPPETWQEIAPKMGERDTVFVLRRIMDAWSLPRWRNPMNVKYAATASTIVLAALATLLFIMLVNSDGDEGDPVPAANPTVPSQPTPDLQATVRRAGDDATATALAQVTPTPEPTATAVPTATATIDPVLGPYQAALDAGEPGPLPQGGYLWIEKNAADPSGRTDNRLILRIEEGVITFPLFQGNVWKFKYTSTGDMLIVTDPNSYCGGAPVLYSWTMVENELFMNAVDRDTCYDRRVVLEPVQVTGEGWLFMN
jgi:hypothetical protein